MAQDRTVGEKILKHTTLGVRAEGVEVVMTVGNGNIRMGYELALKMSVFLRHAARIAKRAAGDHRLLITPFADLTDANADELNASLSKDKKSVYMRH